eukprot:Skav204412  [mRNA]  locus=scaffold398:166413:168713:- [translate_table: standard]
MNELERRMIMAKLPHGSLLTQLIVPKNSSIRASGDDLSNYFYLLKHHEEWLGRNTIGSPVKGREFLDYGCEPEKEYILSFKVIAMGDSNAVDLAQETHFQILREVGCLRPDETVAFRCRLPAKSTWEGLYIDDHVVTQVLPKKKFRLKKSKWRDEVVVENSRKQYAALGLPVSSKKQFTKVEDFTAWGTSVSNQSGRVGAPLTKLKQLSQLILEVCQLPFVTKKLLQKTVGLLVHPAMHRRIFMSLLQETYLWIEKLQPTEKRRLPPPIREELLWMALCLPLMHSNMRWPVSKRVAATDASTTGGGRAATMTSQTVANTLYRFSEHRGEASRLDWSTGNLAPPSNMDEAPSELEDLMLAHVWNTTHKCSFGHKQHINILEMKMLKAELKDLVHQHAEPHRAVTLVDSRVVCGAFSKGRSSSRQLNRILRSMIGWLIAGQKSLHLVWVQSKANPSDHPSRGKAIPEPIPNDPVIRESLGLEAPELQQRRSNREIHKIVRQQHTEQDCELPPSSASTFRPKPHPELHPACRLWTFKEIFAGKGRLTNVFKQKGLFSVEPSLELYQRGKRCKKQDIMNDSTFDSLCELAKRGKQFWHFGLPCSSFSIMQNMNKGTRTASQPAGNGSLDRELLGNELLRRTVHLCRLLHEAGSFFTIENPHTSWVWSMPEIRALGNLTGAKKVGLDQCCYGLKIPDSEHKWGLAKKGTFFFGTLPNLENLAAKCTHDHAHVPVIGGVKVRGKWQKRSSLAGAYPQPLCTAYHSCCRKAFQ